MVVPEALLTGHCSNHVYNVKGCLDCDMAAFLLECSEWDIDTVIGKIDEGFKKIRFRQGVHHLRIDHGTPSPKVQMIRQQLQSMLTKFLHRAANLSARAAHEKAIEVMKAGDEDEIMQILRAANNIIPWEDIVDSTSQELQAAAELGGMDGITQLAIQVNLVPDMEQKVVTAAQDYAKRRAAELIGKKFVNGELIGDSDAQWVISETTRDDLRDIIEQAFEEGMAPSDIADAIRLSTTFGPERAELIARTEISIAQVQGNLGVWKRTGFVKTVNVLLSSDHAVVDECDDVASGGPYPIDDVPFIPRHPRCKCVIIAEEISE